MDLKDERQESNRRITSYETKDAIFLKELIEAGEVRSVIDRRYMLKQIAEAHRYVNEGKKNKKCGHNCGTL